MAEVNTTFYDNLPDNSTAAREARKKEEQKAAETKRAEKVVRGKVKTRKNEIRKLSDVFISEDAANVKNYILMDVIVPAIKRALYDGVTNSLDMILFGGRGGKSKRSTADTVSYRDYNGVSRKDDRPRARTEVGYTYDDIIFDTRADAKAVLEKMDEIMEQYDQVTVADMYDLSDLTSEYTDNRYGWVDIRSAEIVNVRGGYKIKMPRARALNR